jgi:hypothetical protein
MNRNHGSTRTVLGRLAFVSSAALILTLSSALLCAQEPKKEEQKPAAPASQPAPTDGFKWGLFDGRSDIEVGYRWVSDIGGNSQMYRSMVNLGDGVKLLRANVSLRSNYGSGGLFDHFDLSMNSWGGDPYNTARMSMGRRGLYEFRLDYRNLNYYNNIATFANARPELGRNFSEHAMNTTIRTTDLEFKLTTSKTVQPFFGYSRTTGFGPGFTTWHVTNTEFELASKYHYGADEYRGGVDFQFSHLALNVEQGLRALRNDSGIVQSGDKYGSRPGSTFLGEVNRLDSLNLSYHDRATLPFAKGVMKYTPFDFLSISGRYTYAMADLEATDSQLTQGNIVSLENRLVYGAALETFNASAHKPSHNGGFTLEVAPLSRLRFIDQFEVRHFNVSGTTLMTALFYRARPLVNPSLPAGDARASSFEGASLMYDQVRNLGEFEFELGKGVSARAGLRYTSYEAQLANTDSYGTDLRGATYSEHTAIFGVDYRPRRWAYLAAEYENNSPGGGPLLRTDVLDYDRMNFEGRVGPWQDFSLNGKISVFRNKNPEQDIDYKSHNKNYSFGLNYQRGERFNFNLDYTHSDVYSVLSILIPATFEWDRSIFSERTGSFGGSFGVDIYHGTKFDLGYRRMSTTGDFPLIYNQPFASLSVPLRYGLAFKSYWQYFGYNERSASAQDYRTHLVTFGLAYTR